MNAAIKLFPQPQTDTAECSYDLFTTRLSDTVVEQSIIQAMADKLDFRKVTPQAMPAIWEILGNEPSRTTDFSYGGLLMWVDYFHYEYAIIHETLFIKGRVESDVRKTAFSMPVGRLPIETSIEILRQYCRDQGIDFELSAVPEEYVNHLQQLGATAVEPLTDWSDYLYDAETLATLKGKKMGKKRNHVNAFLKTYEDYTYQPITGADINSILRFMDKVDSEGDMTDMAVEERVLNRFMLEVMRRGDLQVTGAMLKDAQGNILAFTIGDIKGDTLFIHIEKSLRTVNGGFEMINKAFAENQLALHPEIKYINREDDSGDPGLRRAKESYHPVELLKKYNVIFAD